MADLLWFAVATLSAARLTRLVVTDTLTEGARHAVLRRVAHPARARARADAGHAIEPPTRVRQWFLDLLTCPWCIGAWISAGVVTGLYLVAEVGVSGLWWVDIPVLSLAAAYMVGWLADQEAA